MTTPEWGAALQG